MAMKAMRKNAAARENAMVARNRRTRKRPRPKFARSLKFARGLKSRACAALAARFIGDQVECRCDEATCLARQAGPGPRI